MAFRRKVRDRHPKCEIYQCANRAVHHCGTCQQLLCEDCKAGHIAAHAKRMCLHG